jgi:hypothetical protein
LLQNFLVGGNPKKLKFFFPLLFLFRVGGIGIARNAAEPLKNRSGALTRQDYFAPTKVLRRDLYQTATLKMPTDIARCSLYGSNVVTTSKDHLHTVKLLVCEVNLSVL